MKAKSWVKKIASVQSWLDEEDRGDHGQAIRITISIGNNCQHPDVLSNYWRTIRRIGSKFDDFPFLRKTKKPSLPEDEVLKERALKVISVMKTIPELQQFPLNDLKKVRLGFLRDNSVRTHGVCMYNFKLYRNRRDGTEWDCTKHVEIVKIHPLAITDKWIHYGNHVIYHEFLHALGFSNHGKEFRRLEALWPYHEASKLDTLFTELLLKQHHNWVHSCSECDYVTYSINNSSRGYLCRTCKTILKRRPRER